MASETGQHSCVHRFGLRPVITCDSGNVATRALAGLRPGRRYLVQSAPGRKETSRARGDGRMHAACMLACRDGGKCCHQLICESIPKHAALITD